jgi:hypothetical protein
MAIVARTTVWSDGQTLTASALNGEFNNILADYNGGITNANISNSAGIAESKVTFNTSSGHTHNGSDSKALADSSITSRKVQLTSAETSLSSNFTTAANSAEQTITGLTTSVTDIGVNSKVFVLCHLNLGPIPAGNTNIRLKVDGVGIANQYRSVVNAAEQTVVLSGIVSHTTGSNVAITVTIQNDSSNTIITFGDSAFPGRSKVLAIAWSQ